MSTETILKTKKTDILSVDPRIIVIDSGFNVRLDMGDIEGLSQSIIKSGLQVPLKVVKVRGKEEYRLIDGHRRFAAIQLAISNGVSIPYVQVTLFSGSVEDEVFSMIITGTGQKQLNEVEQAEGIKRLIEYGYTPEEISEKIGKSVSTIHNLISVGKFPKRIKDRIVSGKISANTVLTIYREAKDNIDKFISIVDDAINNAQQDSKDGEIKKATIKNVSGLKAKTPIQKLTEAYNGLIAEGVNNEKVDLLETVIHKSKTMSVEELMEFFK